MDSEFTYTVDTNLRDPKILEEIKRATKVTIMGGVDIPSRTFYGCQLLREVLFSEKGEIKCGREAFRECGIKKLMLHPNVVLEEGVFEYCSDLTEVTIVNGVTNIPQNTFLGCASLQTVEIPEKGEIKCGGYAFRGCGIKEFVLRPNFKLDGILVFANCLNLAKVTIMEGVTYIPDFAFHVCRSLQTVEFPKKGEIKCGDYAFHTCGIEELVLTPNVKLGERVFMFCHSLANVTIMDGVTIPVNTFSRCKPNMTIYTNMPTEQFKQGFPDIELQIIPIEGLTQQLATISGSDNSLVPTAVRDIMARYVLGDISIKRQSAGYLFTKKKYYDLVHGSDYF